MTQALHIDGAELHLGDCLEVLRGLPEASVDACVCDPPYDLLQASRKGSGRSNEPNNPYGRHGSPVGGFMGLAWDATGIAFKPETWAEVLRVLKPGAHLVAAGGTRTYHRMTCAIEDVGFEIRDCLAWHYGTGFPKSLNVGDGRGTALKPGFEPFVLARKPLVGTVAANVLEHGTGALNIGACRIAADDAPMTWNGKATLGFRANSTGEYAGKDESAVKTPSGKGRWPANVVFSHLPDCTDAACAPGCAVAELDSQSGVLTTHGGPVKQQHAALGYGGGGTGSAREVPESSGGASRFFYCAKPSGDERASNDHPTVKPVALMRWLCRLVTPPNGLVLDPFMGSGTTGVAAVAEGLRFVGIEREPAYFAIAEKRLRAATAQGDLFHARAP